MGITHCHVDGLHVELTFQPRLEESKASRDDVVHIYAVEPQVEICQLVASVWRQDGRASFDLPDLSEETDASVNYYLYAIVEAASTAGTPTLSAAEGATKTERKENRFSFPKCSGVDVVKQQDKKHRNINRRVSRSVFVGAVTMNYNSKT